MGNPKLEWVATQLEYLLKVRIREISHTETALSPQGEACMAVYEVNGQRWHSSRGDYSTSRSDR